MFITTYLISNKVATFDNKTTFGVKVKIRNLEHKLCFCSILLPFISFDIMFNEAERVFLGLMELCL